MNDSKQGKAGQGKGKRLCRAAEISLHTFERICMRYVAGRSTSRAERTSGGGVESVAKSEQASKRVREEGGEKGRGGKEVVAVG